MIYNDCLVDKLCKDHLTGSYLEGLRVLSALRDGRVLHDAAYTEFQAAPLHLAYKLQLLFDRGKKIGLELPENPSPFDISDEPIRKWWQERKSYVPLVSIHEQKSLLHASLCDCAV